MDQKEYFTKSKEYYKKYYAENREKLLAKQCAKIECKFCNKQVQKVNMAKHQSSKLCAKLHEQKLKDEHRIQKAHVENGLEYLLNKGENYYRNVIDL
jgi:hypothetical protein